MKNVFLSLFIILFATIVNGQTLQLSLYKTASTVEVGERFQLKLEFKDLDGEIANIDGINYVDSKNFTKSITVKCDSVGKQELGPYAITIKKKVFMSNTVFINVVEPSGNNSNIDTVITLLVPDTVTQGEAFVLLIKSNVELEKNYDVKGKDGKKSYGGSTGVTNKSVVKISRISTSYKISTIAGIKQTKYIYTIDMRALKAGTVELNKDIKIPYLPKSHKTKMLTVIEE